jgi:hypothetical protein
MEIYLDKFFWQQNYEPVFNCQFQRRMGYRGDGGKWVCDPHRIAYNDCLVYSFGARLEHSFENAVSGGLGCEIHTFDPFWNKTQAYPTKNAEYHLIGVAANPDPHRLVKGKEYMMMTLPSIVKMLKHDDRVIDILKIDIEGEEYDLLRPSLFDALKGMGVVIRQLLIEVHHSVNVRKLFRTLKKENFLIFHKEPNTMADTNCTEYSFINITMGCDLSETVVHHPTIYFN